MHEERTVQRRKRKEEASVTVRVVTAADSPCWGVSFSGCVLRWEEYHNQPIRAVVVFRLHAFGAQTCDPARSRAIVLGHSSRSVSSRGSCMLVEAWPLDYSSLRRSFRAGALGSASVDKENGYLLGSDSFVSTPYASRVRFLASAFWQCWPVASAVAPSVGGGSSPPFSSLS